MTRVRSPAVAGFFYPGEARTLRADVEALLAPVETDAPPPRALIVPHAGYPYSGPVAATAYARLREARHDIRRVVLLGPSHRVPLRGLAASSAEAFATPLGEIPLDREALARLGELPQVQTLDRAHAREHSLEVQLPFLQVLLEDFTLVPLVAGDAEPHEVAAVLEPFRDDPQTLILISSDLSHYHDYATAQRLDRATCHAIETLDDTAIGYEQACGRVPVCGMLALARRHGLAVTTLDLRSSGDTAGPRDQVVGYGAWAFTETPHVH